MLREKVTYEDFNGEEITETLEFNLSKTELTEMNLAQDGGLEKFIDRIVEEKDQLKIYNLFKEIILKAYGKRSDDGKSFIKKDENGRLLSEGFEQTAAFDAFIMDLLSSENAEKATNFIIGVVPKDLAAQVKDAKTNNIVSVS